jgi:hypothetical protein
MFNNITSRKTGFPDSSPAPDARFTQTAWRDVYSKVISALLGSPGSFFSASKHETGGGGRATGK